MRNGRQAYHTAFRDVGADEKLEVFGEHEALVVGLEDDAGVGGDLLSCLVEGELGGWWRSWAEGWFVAGGRHFGDVFGDLV